MPVVRRWTKAQYMECEWVPNVEYVKGHVWSSSGESIVKRRRISREAKDISVLNHPSFPSPTHFLSLSFSCFTTSLRVPVRPLKQASGQPSRALYKTSVTELSVHQIVSSRIAPQSKTYLVIIKLILASTVFFFSFPFGYNIVQWKLC